MRLSVCLLVKLIEGYDLDNCLVWHSHDGLAGALRGVKVLEVAECVGAHLDPSRDEVVLDARFEPVELALEKDRVVFAAEVVQVVVELLDCWFVLLKGFIIWFFYLHVVVISLKLLMIIFIFVVNIIVTNINKIVAKVQFWWL